SILRVGLLGRPRGAVPYVPEIIAHDTAQNEPRSRDRALNRTADFRFADTRMIAHRNFNNPKSGDSAFQDYFHSPSVRGLFDGQSAKHIGARGAKRPQISDLHAIPMPY